jgi:uncharacterized protein (DUF433 family)
VITSSKLLTCSAAKSVCAARGFQFEQILELLEAGVTPEEIIQSFPSVTLDAIAAVERLAAHFALAVVRWNPTR